MLPLTIDTPKQQTIHRLQEKCHVCNSIIKNPLITEFHSNGTTYHRMKFECGHFVITKHDVSPQSQYASFITYEHRNNGCAHDWDKNTCRACGANKPFPFQIAGMEFAERNGFRVGIFDEQGLGKTIQALGVIEQHSARLTPVLVLVKSGIKYQWLSQVVTWLGDKYFAQVITSSKSTLLPGLKFYICSYDILRNFDLTKFEKAGIKLLILDECQQIKNQNASRTIAVRKLAKFIPHILPLSGTPWKNRGSEFFPVLNILSPQKFWSEKAYKDTWLDYYWDGNKYKEGGIRNPARFREYVKDLIIRRERFEVMPELPQVQRNKYVCEVPESARKAYNEATDAFINDYNRAVIDGEEEKFNAFQNDNLILMRQIVGISKVPATCDFIEEFLEETDRKLIVFVHHKSCGKAILERMSEWCLENGIAAPLSITSDMDSQARFTTQEAFNKTNARLLVASTLASGEGLNLQSASDVIMHERQWNPANEQQAEDRVARIGQQANAITATYMHGDDTIDTILDAIIEKKRVAFHQAMNKGEMPVWNESSLMKDLINGIIASRK